MVRFESDLIGDIRVERRLIKDGRFVLKYGSLTLGIGASTIVESSEKRLLPEDMEFLADMLASCGVFWWQKEG